MKRKRKWVQAYLPDGRAPDAIALRNQVVGMPHILGFLGNQADGAEIQEKTTSASHLGILAAHAYPIRDISSREIHQNITSTGLANRKQAHVLTYP